jgi:nucleoside-diphosphate-sugar epimerase
VDPEDVAQAHELALAEEREGFEVYNVSAPTPFRPEDRRRLYEDAGSLLLERYPWVRSEFAARAWQLPHSIDRVYVVDKAIAVLGYRPQHDFVSLVKRPAG